MPSFPLARSALRVPPGAPGLKVGLYGGSFNPPHEGHLHVALTALRRLGLDQVWWLVTPGNPLKEQGELAALDKRIAAVRDLAEHPRFIVTAFEAAHDFSYTADTIAFLKQRRRQVNFVWVMGADNLAGFHRWQHWREIAETMPFAIVDRPGSSLAPLYSKAAQTLSRRRIDERDAQGLALLEPPAWSFLHAPLNPLSSTHLRSRARAVRSRAS